MPGKLPPMPTGVPPGHPYWNDWYEKLRTLINDTTINFTDLDFAGSNLTSIATRNHNDLQNIQGGAAGDHYHLTNAQATDLTDGGDSAAHFHSADRARANHTGTQAISTITEYATGTFTPVMEGTTTAGVGTYTAQEGVYTRIGNIVSFTIRIAISAHTGTGNIEISGLPFTSAATPTNTSFTINASNLTFTGQLYAQNNASTSRVTLRTFTSGAVSSAVAMDTSCSFVISGVYFI